MNANELADELENKPLAYGNDIQEWLGEASKMLRFQQEEINALREQVQYLQTQVYGGTTK